MTSMFIIGLLAAISLLRQHRDKLDALAEALLANETLDESEAYAVAGIRAPIPGSVDRYHG